MGNLLPKTLMKGIQGATLRIQSLIISLEHLVVVSREKADQGKDEAAVKVEAAEAAAAVAAVEAEAVAADGHNFTSSGGKRWQVFKKS